MKIQDSGERRQFETSAVRDISEGKGRCDLLPLDVVGTLCESTVLQHIDDYVREGISLNLFLAIKAFVEEEYANNIYMAMLEVAKHYEEGARKYDERNWEKGIPVHCYIDSGVRHYLKHMDGATDEPHHRAFIWNMLGAIWTHIHKPELRDLPFMEDKKNETNSKQQRASELYSEIGGNIQCETFHAPGRSREDN